MERPRSRDPGPGVDQAEGTGRSPPSSWSPGVGRRGIPGIVDAETLTQDPKTRGEGLGSGRGTAPGGVVAGGVSPGLAAADSAELLYGAVKGPACAGVEAGRAGRAL